MKKKIICFDIDNTICKTVGNKYEKSKPYPKVIDKINQLYNADYYIKIFTSRYMGRNNENSTKAKRIGYKKTFAQLITWGLKFHELIMGKPSYDIIIDDKSFDFKKDWIKRINVKKKNKLS